jgi:hypothetical protein
VPIPNELANSTEVRYSLPYFKAVNTGGVLPAAFESTSGLSTMVIYSTENSGRNWQLKNKFTGIANASLAVSVLTKLDTLAGFVDGNEINIRNVESGNHHAVKRTVPTIGRYGLIDMEFGDVRHGWLRLYGNQRLGQHTGYASLAAWLKTDDGGCTFTPLFPK